LQQGALLWNFQHPIGAQGSGPLPRLFSLRYEGLAALALQGRLAFSHLFQPWAHFLKAIRIAQVNL
jgi:hypothetical protein